MRPDQVVEQEVEALAMLPGQRSVRHSIGNAPLQSPLQGRNLPEPDLPTI